MSNELHEFFKERQNEDGRSVDREDFKVLCKRFEISDKDADVLFNDLDLDRDDRISFEDFCRGFPDFGLSSNSPALVGECLDHQSEEHHSLESQKDDEMKHHVWSALTGEAEKVQKGENVSLKWLLSELQLTEKRHLVPYLENAVEDLLTNLQRLQEEKALLEKSWKREKQEHERHLKRMEEEMDNQVKETEMKLRLKAQADVEEERKTLQNKMDAEMDNLQVHLELFDKVNEWLKNHPQDPNDTRLQEVKTKLDDAVNENRQLRMSLLDTQTNQALMRSELLQLRTLYEEKCRELCSEREKILEVLQEQNQLSRQLTLLHDVNKRLQDTNDSLRSSIDQPNLSTRWMDSTFRAKSGSIIGDYIDVGYANASTLPESEEMENDLEEDNRLYKKGMRRARSVDVLNSSYHKRSKNSERRQGKRYLNFSESDGNVRRDVGEQDEGFSSTPDSSFMAKEEDQSSSGNSPTSISTPDDDSPEKPRRSRNDFRKICSSSDLRRESISDSSSPSGISTSSSDMPTRKISEIISQLRTCQDSPMSFKMKLSVKKKPVEEILQKTPDVCEDQKEQEVLKPSTIQQEVVEEKDPIEQNTTCTEEDDATNSVKSKGDSDQDDLSLVDEMSVHFDSDYEPDGPPERAFNVIFVGDAGVGKSSFAQRITKGVFVRHTSSTLCVDFLQRIMHVDGHNIEVILWDTVGQEKFRSLTKSYFRKADGVMLLYDCTCEQSFLSVRQWCEDVNVYCFYNKMATNYSPTTSIAPPSIPLMVVANKIDLRPASMSSGKIAISTEDGTRLAKECEAAFIEASAKDGSNVLRALANLIRSMSVYKELQSATTTMKLSDLKQPKKSGCCGR